MCVCGRDVTGGVGLWMGESVWMDVSMWVWVCRCLCVGRCVDVKETYLVLVGLPKGR